MHKHTYAALQFGSVNTGDDINNENKKSNMEIRTSFVWLYIKIKPTY